MEKSFYENFVGKSVVVKAGEEKICGRLYSVDGYLNIALETPQDTVYIKGASVDYVSLARTK